MIEPDALAMMTEHDRALEFISHFFYGRRFCENVNSERERGWEKKQQSVLFCRLCALSSLVHHSILIRTINSCVLSHSDIDPLLSYSIVLLFFRLFWPYCESCTLIQKKKNQQQYGKLLTHKWVDSSVSNIAF